MPQHSLLALKDAIESAPEMTDEHRREMLELVDQLAQEVEGGEAVDPEKLRGALAAAEGVVRQRTGQDHPEDHDLSEHLADLEKKVELAAVEHPVLANILNALSRLV